MYFIWYLYSFVITYVNARGINVNNCKIGALVLL